MKSNANVPRVVIRYPNGVKQAIAWGRGRVKAEALAMAAAAISSHGAVIDHIHEPPTELVKDDAR